MGRQERTATIATEIFTAFDAVSRDFDYDEIPDLTPEQTFGQLHLKTNNRLADSVPDSDLRDHCYIFSDAAFLDATRLHIISKAVAESNGFTEKRAIGQLLLAGSPSLMRATRLESSANGNHPLRTIDMELQLTDDDALRVGWTKMHEKWIGENQSPLLHRCPASYLQVEQAGAATLMGQAFWNRLITVAYCLESDQTSNQ